MSVDFGGTDDYGFCGLPSGQYKVGTGLEQYAGQSKTMIALWTTDVTDKDGNVDGARRLFKGGQSGFGRGGGAKNYGHSIRCVKNIE